VTTLVKDLVRVGEIVPMAPWQKLGYACAALLMGSGVFHGVVYLVDGGDWAGPLSWRKPVVFGLSFGITLLTVTWLAGFLRPSRRWGWVTVGLLSAASVGEVFLISMQTWRGVPSHFNEDTAFDGMVFSLMGMLVSIVGLTILVVTVRAFIRINAPPSLALAIRLGLLLMLVSQGVGAQMIAEGGNTYGSAGALKVPHAFTLHAVQVLPALALLMLVSRHEERWRTRVVALGAVGYALLIAASMVQTYAGRGPADLDVGEAVLAVAGLVVLAVAAVLALRGLATRSDPTDVVGRPVGASDRTPTVPGQRTPADDAARASHRDTSGAT
jgi:hypothetical protein